MNLLIEPPLRGQKKRPATAQDRKRKEARLFLKSVADRLKVNQQNVVKAQKATWQPSSPSQALQIFEDSARVIEAERLQHEYRTLQHELNHLKGVHSALELEVKKLTTRVDALPPLDIQLDDLIPLKEGLEEQRQRLARELESLKEEGTGDVSIPGATHSCPMCTENMGKVVPPVDQKLAELRLILNQLQTELSEHQTKLAGRKAAAQHYQQLLTGAPNVTREEQRLKVINDQIVSISAKLEARRGLTAVAESAAPSVQAVVTAMEQVREAEEKPEIRSHSVTVLKAKDAWASAPSAVRSKLKELHSRRTALQKELDEVVKDLMTPIEEDAYLYSEVRKTMLHKKVRER